MTEPKSGLSRRTVLKGAAWSVPVVAVAAAVPLAAASGVTELEFYLTAGEVIGGGPTGGSGTSGQFRSNGIRLTAPDGRTIAAGVTVVFTLTYTGSEPVDFTDPQFGVTYNLQQNPGWTIGPIEPNRVVFTATSTVATSEVTFQAASWYVNAGVRPENNSITFTGIAMVPPGGDFPVGGTITSLVVDPNQGTGALSGPTDTTWPV